MIQRKNFPENVAALLPHVTDHKIRGSELERLLIEACHCIITQEKRIKSLESRIVHMRAQVDVLSKMTVQALRAEVSEGASQ